MPSLTVTLTDAQAARVEAAFGSLADAEVWLRGRLIEQVITIRQKVIQREALERQRAAADSLKSELEPAPPAPPGGP